LRYKKKPEYIEAFRFKIDEYMPDWVADAVTTNDIILRTDGSCTIQTFCGPLDVGYGDYIVKDRYGHLGYCTAQYFELLYDLVEEDTF
jgi:hypothetical protein